MPVNDCESTRTTDSGVTNKFQRVGEFANIESMNNEDQLYGGKINTYPAFFDKL